MSPNISCSLCRNWICFIEEKDQANSSPPLGETMAPAESFPERRAITKFLVKSVSEDFTFTVAAQDHNSLETTIDFLVDLLSNGDIGKQRQAAEALIKLKRASRDRLRVIGATSLLVDLLSSPDVHIREHMITLLYRLSSDDEETYRQQSRREASGDTFNRRTTNGVIHSLLRGGPGPKAYETAAKLLLKLTNIDDMKETVARSGGIESLIEMLRFKKGLGFQKEVIATLIRLLGDHHEYKARAIKGGLPSTLLRHLVHGPPKDCDMDGILELMALLATDDAGHDVLVQINTPQALVALVGSGKLLQQREKVAKLARTLTEDYKQATKVFEDLSTPPGDDGGGDLGKDTIRIELTPVPSQNGARGTNGSANRDTKSEIKQITEVPEITEIQNPSNRKATKPEITKNMKHPASNGNTPKSGSKPSRNASQNGSVTISKQIIKKGYAGAEDADVIKSVPAVIVPEEFICPLSKQIMTDPVTVSTGTTYDREFIQRWIDKGKITCPQTRYRLKHFMLKPNAKVKTKILLWHEKNEELAKEFEQSSLKEQQHEAQHEFEHEKLEPKEEEQAEDPKDVEDYKPSPISWEKAAREADPPRSPRHNTIPSVSVEVPVQIGKEQSGIPDSGRDQKRLTCILDINPAKPPMMDPEKDDPEALMGELEDRPATAEEVARVQTLMEVLASKESSELDLTVAALEMHELARVCQSLRDEIVIVGALDVLASLLSSKHSANTQEAGVATLLILSLNDDNKKAMAHQSSSVVPAVVRLLKIGSEDGREKAASTLFSLSIPDENKVSIGASHAIPALVDILSGRDPLSKKAQKDAATCLLTLSIYTGNKARAVRVGVVPYLVALLDDASLLDLVLAMLAVLSSHPEGREAIQEEKTILPKLTHIMRSGVDRNIENALTIFSTLLMKNQALFQQAARFGALKLVFELHSKAPGPCKIKTKTSRLLEFMKKYDISLT